MTGARPRTARGGPLFGLLLVAILSLAARADPVRLGESELRAVVVDGRFGPREWPATDWLRRSAWLDHATPIPRLAPLVEFRPSRPSLPQTVRRFDLGRSAED